MKKQIIKYSFEFIVIMLGILISLFLEQRRQDSIESERKNNTIKQLVNVIEEDINQIDGFIYLLGNIKTIIYFFLSKFNLYKSKIFR